MRTSYLAHSVVVVSLAILGVTPALAQTPAGGSASAPQFATTSFLAPTRATWDSTRSLVVRLIEAMPEDKWDFKPTPAVRSFREIVAHLIGENYLFFGRVAGENPANPAQNLKTRDELLKALHESYAYGAKVWGDLTEAKALEMIEGRSGQKVQRWSPILIAIQDNMNHYGNLVVYLRLNGVVPPRSARQ
jgi:uncharacterized damage-inducible protein DinB